MSNKLVQLVGGVAAKGADVFLQKSGPKEEEYELDGLKHESGFVNVGNRIMF